MATRWVEWFCIDKWSKAEADADYSTKAASLEPAQLGLTPSSSY